MPSRTQLIFISFLCGLLFFVSEASAEKSCGFATQRVQCGDMACDRNLSICINCREDADCYPGAMRCNTANGKCVVSNLTATISFRTIIAMIGAFLVCSVAVIAGVGGGGILVPMFTGLMKLPMATSVGLSQSTICGQSTLNVIISMQEKFPDENWSRPLINYQYLSLLLPLGLIGTLLGGILSKVCPDIMRLILLFLLLSAVLYRTVQKMMAQYAKDKEAETVTVEAKETKDYGSSEMSRKPANSEGAGAPPAPPQKPAQPQYPKEELSLNFLCFFSLLIFNILRTYCSCGGVVYWICVLAPFLLLTTAFFLSRNRLKKLAAEEPERLTFKWNDKTSKVYPMVAVVAGAAAAMLGIGGGLVLGFVLYEVGLIPREASVTGGMATFFIAFSSALQLLVSGTLLIDYGAVFFVVGVASTSLGQFVFMKYIKAHGLNYLIVGSLAFVVGGSLVVLGGYGIYNSVISSKNGGSVMAFGSLCNR